MLPCRSGSDHEEVRELSVQPDRRTLVRMRGCQSSVSTLMVQSTLLMTLTSDSMIRGANPNPVRWIMRSLFVTMRYVAAAVPHTMSGHTTSKPKTCKHPSSHRCYVHTNHGREVLACLSHACM